MPETLRVQAARALLRIDPTNEAALHHEVLSFAQSGDTVRALQSYRRFEKLLASDYGLKPGAELQALIHRVQADSQRSHELTLEGQTYSDRVVGFPDDYLGPDHGGRSVTTRKQRGQTELIASHSFVSDVEKDAGQLTRVAAAPRGERATVPPGRANHHTIVIRLDPFAVQGVDPSQSYLILGFRHALTASLVRFREWIVVDGSHGSGPGRGSEQEYDYSLAATLYEVDGAIEVVLTLLRIQDLSYLWSQIIRLQLEKWLATQHDIIRSIASTLQVHISAERLTRGADQATMPVTAFDQWLRAQAAAFTLERSRIQEARAILTAVAHTNPTYSPLFSALAQLDNIDSMVHPGVFRNPLTSRSAI